MCYLVILFFIFLFCRCKTFNSDGILLNYFSYHVACMFCRSYLGNLKLSWGQEGFLVCSILPLLVSDSFWVIFASDREVTAPHSPLRNYLFKDQSFPFGTLMTITWTQVPWYESVCRFFCTSRLCVWITVSRQQLFVLHTGSLCSHADLRELMLISNTAQPLRTPLGLCWIWIHMGRWYWETRVLLPVIFEYFLLAPEWYFAFF